MGLLLFSQQKSDLSFWYCNALQLCYLLCALNMLVKPYLRFDLCLLAWTYRDSYMYWIVPLVWICNSDPEQPN